MPSSKSKRGRMPLRVASAAKQCACVSRSTCSIVRASRVLPTIRRASLFTGSWGIRPESTPTPPPPPPPPRPCGSPGSPRAPAARSRSPCLTTSRGTRAPRPASGCCGCPDGATSETPWGRPSSLPLESESPLSSSWVVVDGAVEENAAAAASPISTPAAFRREKPAFFWGFRSFARLSSFGCSAPTSSACRTGDTLRTGCARCRTASSSACPPSPCACSEPAA